MDQRDDTLIDMPLIPTNAVLRIIRRSTSDLGARLIAERQIESRRHWARNIALVHGDATVILGLTIDASMIESMLARARERMLFADPNVGQA